MVVEKRPFSEPNLTIISLNVEGISNVRINSNLGDILCLQKIHRGPTLVKKSPHDQYGNAVWVKPEIKISNVLATTLNIYIDHD